VLPSNLAADFDPPISLPSVTRKVRTFGNHQVTLRGPLTLELQLFGFRTRHPFYFIDALTPAIGGYDLMQAARLVVDVASKRVWSHRPESATKSPCQAALFLVNLSSATEWYVYDTCEKPSRRFIFRVTVSSLSVFFAACL